MVQGIGTALYGTCRSALLGEMNTASPLLLQVYPEEVSQGFQGPKERKVTYAECVLPFPLTDDAHGACRTGRTFQ